MNVVDSIKCVLVGVRTAANVHTPPLTMDELVLIGLV